MKIRQFAFWMCLGLIVVSCNNDFDLIDEGNEQPVVYGFINIGQDTQYIRVEKTFAGEDINAFEAAKREDSVFYSNALVTLVKEDGEEFVLERVDASLDGIEREEGDFLRNPNIAYRITTSELNLAGGETITLRIDTQDGEESAEAETTILSPLILRTPLVDEPVNISPTGEVSFDFQKSENTGMIGLMMYMYVREIDQNDPSKVELVEVPWKILSGFDVSQEKEYVFTDAMGRAFYAALAENLDATKNVFRQFSHFDIVVSAGGFELVEFRRIERANSGLTGAQELPLYSNVDGGIGIFSSKYTERYSGFTIREATRDSLANNSLTEDFNFVD